MSEMLRDYEPELAQVEALEDLLPPLAEAPASIRENVIPSVGERLGFEIPRGLWRMMVACYVIFLTALLAATAGSGHAIFAIVISFVYVAMFFGVTRIIVALGPEQERSPLKRAGGVLQTIYGPLKFSEVVAQMLVVPGAITFFGVAILVIRVAVVG